MWVKPEYEEQPIAYHDNFDYAVVPIHLLVLDAVYVLGSFGMHTSLE